MPTKERMIADMVADYERRLTRRGYSPSSMKRYRWVIRTALTALMEAGRPYQPAQIREVDILWLIRSHWKDRKEQAVKGDMSILGGFLERTGRNPVIRTMDLRWGQDTSLRVDWLSPQELRIVNEEARGIEQIIIHLESRLGLRRIEVQRVRISDIDWFGRTLTIRGKGRGGGKLRTVRFHRETEPILRGWMVQRQGIIAKAERGEKRRTSPRMNDLESLLICYSRASGLKSPGMTTLDNVIQRVSRRTGVKFSHHTLRRTWGRMLWLAGVPLETIAQMMGHSTTKTTIRYLGINLDDQADAMKKLAAFEESMA